MHAAGSHLLVLAALTIPPPPPRPPPQLVVPAQPATRVHDNAECAMCKSVVTRVKVAVNNSETLEKVKEVALQVCGRCVDDGRGATSHHMRVAGEGGEFELSSSRAPARACPMPAGE